MADVFISYKRSESTSALVRRIADELESMDISCWYDTKDPDPGHFADIIEKEIECCKTFLFIWDIGANQSDWCCDEVFAALAHKKLIIPLQLGQFEKRAGLSLRLRSFNIFYGGNSAENADIREFINKIADAFHKIPTKIIKSGLCGDSVTYALAENGILVISGTGTMRSFDASPWQRENVSCVRINYGVISIGDFAFASCTNLNSVIIPDSVVEIGIASFYGCINLTTVTIPDSVKYIEKSAFQKCTRLTNVNISNNALYVGQAAFYDCTRLTNINIPKSVTSIGRESFYGCKRLVSVNISNGVVSIGDGAFDNCISLTSVNIPDSVTNVGMYAFRNCPNLVEVSIPLYTNTGSRSFPETATFIYRE